MSAPASVSEHHLHTLAQHAFLRLWSYPNLYHCKGAKTPCGPAKELCDLLIVFGSDLVVFSDKHCQLDTGHNPALAWSRWYKEAVLNSASQAAGASRWLHKPEFRVYLDRTCTLPLPIRLPSNPRVHRVLTVRGAADAASSEWGGRGSLLVTNRSLTSCAEAPFRLGCFGEKSEMYHIFDQNALDAVLTTLDTPSDFITYLRQREEFFRRPHELTASSEEDLLGLYLLSWNSKLTQIGFPGATSAPAMFVNRTHWDSWMKGPQSAAWNEANAVSYAWDELIEKFTHHALTGTQEFALPAIVADQEPLLRWLGRETRFHRRIFSSFITTMLRSTPPGVLRRRYVQAEGDGDPYWVFVVYSPRPGTPYDVYRKQRRDLLTALVYVVKHLHPNAMDIVGLAFGGDSDGISEDALHLDGRHWNEDLAKSAQNIYESTGFFTKPPTAVRFHEYPGFAADVEE
jgi:hypothetical protein